MTRRGLFAPALGLLAAACSPLGLLNSLLLQSGIQPKLHRSGGSLLGLALELFAPIGT